MQIELCPLLTIYRARDTASFRDQLRTARLKSNGYIFTQDAIESLHLLHYRSSVGVQAGSYMAGSAPSLSHSPFVDLILKPRLPSSYSTTTMLTIHSKLAGLNLSFI